MFNFMKIYVNSLILLACLYIYLSTFLPRNMPDNNGLLQQLLHASAEDEFPGLVRHDIKALLGHP
jgi:hypothetical protein